MKARARYVLPRLDGSVSAAVQEIGDGFPADWSASLRWKHDSSRVYMAFLMASNAWSHLASGLDRNNQIRTLFYRKHYPQGPNLLSSLRFEGLKHILSKNLTPSLPGPPGNSFSIKRPSKLIKTYKTPNQIIPNASSKDIQPSYRRGTMTNLNWAPTFQSKPRAQPMNFEIFRHIEGTWDFTMEEPSSNEEERIEIEQTKSRKRAEEDMEEELVDDNKRPLKSPLKQSEAVHPTFEAREEFVGAAKKASEEEEQDWGQGYAAAITRNLTAHVLDDVADTMLQEAKEHLDLHAKLSSRLFVFPADGEPVPVESRKVLEARLIAAFPGEVERLLESPSNTFITLRAVCPVLMAAPTKQKLRSFKPFSWTLDGRKFWISQQQWSAADVTLLHMKVEEATDDLVHMAVKALPFRDPPLLALSRTKDACFVLLGHLSLPDWDSLCRTLAAADTLSLSWRDWRYTFNAITVHSPLIFGSPVRVNQGLRSLLPSLLALASKLKGKDRTDMLEAVATVKEVMATGPLVIATWEASREVVTWVFRDKDARAAIIPIAKLLKPLLRATMITLGRPKQNKK